MAELADALDLGSSTNRCGGSSPFTRIIFMIGTPISREFGRSVFFGVILVRLLYKYDIISSLRYVLLNYILI